MANPIRFSDVFDFTNDKDVQAAIKTIKSLDKVYTAFLNNSKKLKGQYAADMQHIVKATQQLNKVVAGLNPTLQKDQQQLSAASKSMDILTASSQGLTQKTATLGTTIKALESEQKKFNSAAKETIKLDKEQERLKAKLASLDTKQAAETAKLRAQITQKNKELRRSAQESLKLVSIYDREVNALRTLTQRYKDVAIQYGVNSKQARALKIEMDKLRESITRVNRATGNFSDNVGNYPKRFALAAGGVRQLAAALGFTGVIFALVGAFRNAFKTIRDFQQQNAVLAGVLDKTRGEITALTSDAERLGASTAKSASEVTQLQIAYARLGFTQEEILNLTEDTINGSIALNANLAETAELTGAVIRTFDDLGTTDADVVLDQMTAATQRSALNFEKLQTGLPIVAGAANAAGISFTRLLALLGKLSDAGIDASMSSTALRNIFIESASQGLNYQEILQKISGSADQLTASTDEFGKRAAVSGTILSNLTEEVGVLDVALQSAGGTAERVAKEQLDTLSGEITLLASAWEGWILSIEKGDGVLGSFIRTTLRLLTVTFSFLAIQIDEVSKQSKDLVTDYNDQAKSLQSLYGEYQKLSSNVNKTEEEKQRLTQIAIKLRGILGDSAVTIDTETQSFKLNNDEVEKAIKARLLLANQEASSAALRLKNIQNQLTGENNLNDQLKEQKVVLKAIEDSGVSIADDEALDQYGKAYDAVRQLTSQISDLEAKEKELTDTLTELGFTQEDIDDIFINQANNIKKSTNKYTILNNKYKESIKISSDYQKQQDELGKSTDFVFESTEDIVLASSNYEKQLFALNRGSGNAGKSIEEMGEKIDKSIPDERQFSGFEKFLLRIQKLALYISTAFDSASIAVNQFFTNQDIKRENSFVKFEDQRQSEIDALEAKREKELENENLTTESKKAINKKYAEAIGAIEGQIEDKRKQTQKQQAKSAKKQAIFNILLNTAQGITAALTSIPPNVPLSIAIGIIGGVQLAAAASQPLPAFAKGTDNAPGGLAVVGDGGKRELVMEPSGRTYLTSDRPEIRNIPKGSKVFPDADLVDREFGSTIMRNITAGQAFDREIDNHNASVNKLQAVLNQERLNNDQFRKTLTATLEKENDYMINKFISGLHSLPLNNWSFTDKGQVTRSVQKGNTIRKNVELENKY